ncbi:SHS2 domain-containing protein [Thermus arciformis]|uniref:SHS2 domain-containing protein n=1 Tax=Thermus arciformis TaxID=482827 RepID=A0A1G7HN38_9DEIN|nr:archease [Thermus arciformis]SDF01756.1 SHS2 domain-containing protein [Thermus arciformis]
MVVKPLEHTADVGFLLEAESLEGLFQAALQGLLQVMFQNPPQGGRRRRRVALEAEDLETLLVRYLNELIYLIQTKGFVPGKARVRLQPKEGGFRLEATLFGEPFQEAFGFQGEVKSATYHGLSVAREGGRWKAQVILDV